MLKFIKHHLSTMGGVEIYPIISLLIFFTIFVLAVVWAVRAKKQHISEMSNMPLED